MARILLGVTGGIAAYKALELIRLATGAGHSVRVVQTPTSRRFVGAASFAALSGGPALWSEFARDPVKPEEIFDVRFVSPAGNLKTLPFYWSERGGMDGFYAARLRRLR